MSENACDLRFPDTGARYDFAGLVQANGGDPRDVMASLWASVWNGQVTSDSFHPVRRGLAVGFDVKGRQQQNLGSRRRFARSRRRPASGALTGFAGNWMRIQRSEACADSIDQAELEKDRVRVLLDRYGLLFREVLRRESPGFRWQDIFPVLRIMELSGEVVTGYFFEGISGPQFMSHAAFRIFRRAAQEVVYWMSAADPSSLCGIDIPGLSEKLPRRTAGNHMVFHGERLVMTSRAMGKHLHFFVLPNDPNLPSYLCIPEHLLTRNQNPLTRLTVETINDEQAYGSPYLDVIKQQFEIEGDGRKINVYARNPG